ncbi:hypothetical protein E4634_02435 [Mangrovimicrobium sediminis]|uniref:Uncharacterized protein n=1 Tax=Mangrovimicrobium sediminis TaxID=2562682 RepID=A0A4Z0M890_9GAMM|nr:hypothetical protein [Haliea sp. SAOS-164]TGD75751.1 hypothetical protein E4634_02435 [Haliea sp. SAOS-164]
MQALLDELAQRWQAMFEALARGEDLPPGRRLRAEGMAEAAVIAGIASAAELDRAMDDCYNAAFGRRLAADFGADWRQFHRFPEIPAVTRRAPVVPTTAD